VKKKERDGVSRTSRLDLCRAAPKVAHRNFAFSNRKFLKIEIFGWKRLETTVAERALAADANFLVAEFYYDRIWANVPGPHH
jgi:hypothetical protein